MQTVRKHHDLWKVATLIAAIFCAGTAIKASRSQLPTTIEIAEALEMEPDFKTTYLSGGMKMTVTTYQKDGDTLAQTATIHKDKVAALLAEFPKDA